MGPHSDSMAPDEMPRCFSLAGVDVEPDAGRIGGRHIDPKAMGVLVHLVHRAQQTVPINEILDVVWPRASVHDNVVHRAVSRLRRALEISSGASKCIETVPRRGYRLVAPVGSGAAEPSLHPAGVAVAPASERTLAIAPFQNRGRVAENLGPELAEALAAALGSTDWEVFDPQRVATVTSRMADPVEVGAALGTRYLLTGTVGRAGGSLRLTARLCYCPTGVQVWTGRWSGTPKEFQQRRSILVRAMAQAVLGRAVRNERIRRPGTLDGESNPWWLLYRAGDIEDFPQRIVLLRRALALDPDFALAHAMLAAALALPRHRGRKREEQRRRLVSDRRHLERALQLAPDDFLVLRECSAAARYFGDPELSLELARRAHAISGLAADVLGIALLNLGHAEEGLALLEEMAREPWELLGDGVSFWATGGHPKIRLAHAYCRIGRFADALQVCNDFLAMRPATPLMVLLKVNLLAQLGRTSQARVLFGELSGWLADWQVDDFEEMYASMAGHPDPQWRPADLGRYVDGLRRVLPNHGCSAAVSDETMTPS
jgi:DNA-binding winged helix-turn-helix (wHTH) protein/tetratricopeptide (TPR) repeat protein